MRIPMLFVRLYTCNKTNGLVPNSNDPNKPQRISYVVMFPTANDWKTYNSSWMCNPHLVTDAKHGQAIYIHDVDIVADEDVFVFDDDDSNVAYLAALKKMQELWASLDLTD